MDIPSLHPARLLSLPLGLSSLKKPPTHGRRHSTSDRSSAQDDLSTHPTGALWLYFRSLCPITRGSELCSYLSRGLKIWILRLWT